MDGDNNNDKKGFSGLAGLVSEVGNVGNPGPLKPKGKTKSSVSGQPPQAKQKAAATKPTRKEAASPPPAKTNGSGNKGYGSSLKWLLGIVGAIVLLVIIGNTEKANKPIKPSQSAKPTTVLKESELQYAKPSIGTSNVLSVDEIHWCVREGFRIEAMRGVVETDYGVKQFNILVDDYNNRCGSYKYYEDSQARAERDVEPYRSQIILEAIEEVKLWGDMTSPKPDTSIPKPSAQYTREAQEILTTLGYNPGSIDGLYGPRTIEAVKAFQRDIGIAQDGWIDQSLLVFMREAYKRATETHTSTDRRPY